MDNKFWKQASIVIFVYVCIISIFRRWVSYELISQLFIFVYDILSYPMIAILELLSVFDTYYPFVYLQDEIAYLYDKAGWNGMLFMAGILVYGSIIYGFYWAFLKK